MASSIDTAELRLGDVFLTRHNAKIASIRDGIKDLILQPDEFLQVPFDPMAFDESSKFNATRLNLFLHPCRSLLEDLATLDEWLIGYLSEHSIEIFKKPLHPNEVKENYISCIRHSAKGFAPTVKTKIDLTDGKHALHCWDSEGYKIDAPETWRNCRISPRLHVSHVWFMGTNFGPVVRLTDALVRPDEDTPVPAKRKSPF